MPEKPSFAHLHVHSDFSLLDGACNFTRLFKRLHENGMNTVALTDHGNMGGIIQFFLEAKKNNIRPVLGCEIYVAPDKKTLFSKDHKPYHLVLLVRNLQGYQNLMYLCSWGYLHGFYMKPQVTLSELEKHSEGLTALSGCLGGEVPALLLQNKKKKARERANYYRDIFGKEYFYLEVQKHGLKEQEKVFPRLIELSSELDIPLVATNDCHYVYPEDSEFHELLLCLQTKSTISDEKRFRFESNQLYLKTPHEMAELFGEFPEAVTNTLRIAEECSEFEIPLNNSLIPNYPSPEGKTVKEYLQDLVWQGCDERYSEKRSELQQRIEYELDIIDQMNFNTYFLTVWDFMNYARNNSIPVGPGRGSVAGSVVAYCLGITKIDPLKYSLIFERFLNPERLSMPDIDIDFCRRKREKMVEYARKRYGKDNVAFISAPGGMKIKGAIRDIGRVLEVSLKTVNYLCREIDKINNVREFRDIYKNDTIKALYKSKKEIKKLLDNAEKIYGFVRHTSVHAAGIIIADEPLIKYTPLFYGKETRGKTGSENKKSLTTQYDMGSVEKVGLLKMDFLGLRTLTVIDDCLDLIKETHGKALDLDDIPFDDAKVYEFIAEGNTRGIFQLEEENMQRLVKAMKPESLDELSALMALHRPGPIGSGMDKTYVNRKFGREKIQYLHPLLEPILKETYGVILYQEQVQKIAHVLADFSYGEADLLRRAMGKKKADLMEKNRNMFYERATNKGIPIKLAQEIFTQMEKFAEYGFNKSHSVAYAYLSYQTAYLKTYYLKEFLACQMTSFIGFPKKLKPYFSELKIFDIPLLPPDINQSYLNFTVTKNAIRFGLAAIKGVGENLAALIIKERKNNGLFKDFIDFAWRMRDMGMNARALEALVKAGAFDFTENNRGTLFANIEALLQSVNIKKRKSVFKQPTLFQLGNPEISQQEFYFDLLPAETWDKNTRLFYEREVLDFFVSHHPVLDHLETIQRFTDLGIFELLQSQVEGLLWIGGWLHKIEEKKSRSGKSIGYGVLENVDAEISLVFFQKVLEKTREYSNQSQVFLVKGSLDMNSGEAFTSREMDLETQNGEEGTMPQENRIRSTKFVVDDIVPLRLARKVLVGKIVFTIDHKALVKRQKELREIFEQHKGTKPLIFRVKLDNAFELQLQTSQTISPTVNFEKDIKKNIPELDFRYEILS